MGQTKQVGEAIAAAMEYLREHANEAGYTDSEAIASLGEGLHVTVRGPSGHLIETDMARSVGGTGEGPSAGWLFRAAIASCDATLIGMRAAMLGVELTEVKVTIDSESNDYGILGIDDAIPPGPLSVRTRIRVAAKDADDRTLRELVEWAVGHCPVHDATKRAVPMSLEIETS
jgi:uncharacterized OsmC-like protein